MASRIQTMVEQQGHRGPDGTGVFSSDDDRVALGHCRLSIIDLSAAGAQPMADPSGRFQLSFNGEIYNYLELRRLLTHHRFRTETDSEVILAAYAAWGPACLDRFIGMFALAIWDREARRLFIARDRFGVKPVYYAHDAGGALLFASEIRALHAAGIPMVPDVTQWATYLASGMTDQSERTFWEGISSLPPGHTLTWERGRTRIDRWYDLPSRAGDAVDDRDLDTVLDEYHTLLRDSVRLRFRADVPVGVNLSGGLDSSLLLGLIHDGHHEAEMTRAYSFVTGDDRYDELPWVAQMLAHTRHKLSAPLLSAEDVPALAASVHRHQSEPFGGIPTLAYARLFEHARNDGVLVLLDGQGMDEQWAGYDYYSAALEGRPAGVVQGTGESPVRVDTMLPAFRERAEALRPETPFADPLRNLQYRDIRHTKIPRALRFNDRVSMRASVELREPFLDHRLFELAFRQPVDRKIRGGTHKWLLRQLAKRLVPPGISEAPKRPVQTPQREWLRGPLQAWATERIEAALDVYGNEWLDPQAVRGEWARYVDGHGTNSYFVWQWISLGLMVSGMPASTRA